MPISREKTLKLSKPTGDERVPPPTLAYIKARGRMRAFTAIHKERRKAGITNAQLAKRAGKGLDRISHLLAAPQNVTIDTMNEILFCISGTELNYETLSYPLDQPLRNRHRPAWLMDGNEGQDKTTTTSSAEIKAYIPSKIEIGSAIASSAMAKTGWERA
jgi:hypothetical protein